MKSLIVFFCAILLHFTYGETEVEFKIGQDELILNCSLGVEGVNWYRNGTLIEADNRHELKHENGVHSLKINKPKPPLDIGPFTCQERPSGAQLEFEVYMSPYVSNLAQSFNIPEGEKVRVSCMVYGYPPPVVEWRRSEEDEGVWNDVDATDHISFENNGEIINATMIVVNVDFNDRANYMCLAINDHGTRNSTTLIRVISKYAALWPFLGICAEVIILCIVIFIFEKRRGKKQFEESDNEQNNTKHVANAKDTELRNRK